MEDYRIRVRIFVGIIVAVMGILTLRLGQLQILDRDDFTEESQSNAIREVRVPPARGAIFDRDGRLMVSNQPSYNILITPRYFDESAIPLLADLLAVPDSVVVHELREAREWSGFQPSRAFTEVPFGVFSRVQEHQYRLPGVTYEIVEQRSYLSEANASHALGYIREISDAELERREDANYRPGDLIGKTGVERRYEEPLRGEPGSEFKLVNVHGREIKSYQDGAQDTPPTSGYNLYLGMDERVQALAESLFVGKRGAAVALDPKTGGIIALVSEPDFDPALFSESVDQATWNYLNNSPEKPLYNRATMNQMPPGSTWKPFMALMSLQEGTINLSGPKSTVHCPGYHPLGGGRFFRCMDVHGTQTVISAIQNSCNTFFFEMMMRTDVDTFSRYAHAFGFGERAPTDIGEQTPGIIPDSSYFDRVYPSGWTAGYSINLGIGQGDMGVTPLQLARYVAAIGNKGTLHPPHLVQRMVHPETGAVERPDLPPSERLAIDARYFDAVREGMRRVMEQGTGRLAQIPGIPSGGKTGTAQASGGRKDHSLFVMFAPWDDPEIAVAVQCENAGFGGQCAAPIASLMAELYLKGEIPDTPAKEIRMRRALTARSESIPVADAES
ncbi:MAG: penicillin-binding protein 2 [Bacteroidetes bacterium]|jgi:penicillin-binding protein 2|nr:penicillin-binding protein 2 [Bacteroidota bacterium]